MGDAHRGVSNLNCPVCTFSVAADVGTGIECVGGSAVEGESRVYLPAVGEARWSTEGGNGVIEVSGEGIANIESRSFRTLPSRSSDLVEHKEETRSHSRVHVTRCTRAVWLDRATSGSAGSSEASGRWSQGCFELHRSRRMREAVCNKDALWCQATRRRWVERD